MTFPFPRKRLSKTSDPKLLVCHTATIVLRHDGSWNFTAYLENQETKTDCSFILQFVLDGLPSPFGAVLEGDLSAKGSAGGMALKGIPSSRTFPDDDRFALFMNPGYWEAVLGATPRFDLLPAWKDYADSGDPGESEDKEDVKPKPGDTP